MSAAEDLFYREGIQAVGVDRLLSVSGVGRASFYRHFAGKEELVVAILKRYDTRWRAWLEEVVTAQGGDPLAAFDALGEQFASPDFRGCASVNAMVEAADPDSPAFRVAAEHKRSVIAYLDGLLAEAGHEDHQRIAERFMLLIDGATVTALREQGSAAAQHARAMAQSLLDRPREGSRGAKVG
ncbi:AcrR family transcriptional regulator [Spinactinospora alkalitolerans]|uniref:AcrR family transcriptional regulator n=1 Tax=Spinactinospora alkalitolerans TaxID=687207 RepID=A0A852U356_9ACTN|nr:TetR/AcrR family transcriptional regulator [Spinactinospora alkalitolerans]NYE50601.1 AcrR family transcriptional regulator [Spinactinospora alkalitolerans]